MVDSKKGKEKHTALMFITSGTFLFNVKNEKKHF